MLLSITSVCITVSGQSMSKVESQTFLKEMISLESTYIYTSSSEIPTQFMEWVNQSERNNIYFMDHDSTNQTGSFMAGDFSLLELISGGNISDSGFIIYKLCTGYMCGYYCLVFRQKADKEKFDYAFNLLRTEIENLNTLKDYILQGENIFQ